MYIVHSMQRVHFRYCSTSTYPFLNTYLVLMYLVPILTTNYVHEVDNTDSLCYMLYKGNYKIGYCHCLERKILVVKIYLLVCVEKIGLMLGVNRD